MNPGFQLTDSVFRGSQCKVTKLFNQVLQAQYLNQWTTLGTIEIPEGERNKTLQFNCGFSVNVIQFNINLHKK